MLCVIDEFTRECLAIRVERKLNSRDVLDVLGELFVAHGPPEHIRSDNGPEFIANALRQWLQQLQVKTLYIEPGSPLSAALCLPAGQCMGKWLLRELQFQASR